MEAAAKAVEDRPKKVKGTKILKLVLDGFKSFGKHTELILGDDFNVVIGPNGSGKSNIMDALCFVLGKSSSKQLRAEKSANLIYNGGKSKKPAKQAEVSIVFDNSDNIFPLSESEVKVSRIVRSNGSSKYKINNVTRTRGEVIELLGSAKIDPDGYNIILQGDIVRLVEMSPNERRQIIEDISGIGAYETKKQQALKELGKVEERLNEAEIILKERESYLKELKKDRDQAVKYKSLKDKVAQNKASYLKRQIDRKDKSLSNAKKKSDEHKSKLDKLLAKIKKVREEIDANKRRIQDINKEIEQKGEVEQVKLQKQVEQLRVDLATKKTNLSNCKTELERVAQREAQLKKSRQEVDGKYDGLASKKKELEAQVSAIGKTIDGLESNIKAFKKKHKLSDEADIEKRFEEIDKEAEAKQKELHSLRERQQELIREKDKVEFQIETIDEKIAKVKELEDEHKEELAVLKKKKAEFKKLVLELNSLLNQDSKDANTLAKLRAELNSLREEEHKLSLKHEAVKEHLGKNIAVKKVMENAGKFGEVYGTIAELGSSDSKYALALEVAAANRINSVVVDSDKTAAASIRFLKSEKLGSATFLPLSKIKAPNIKPSVAKLAKEKGVHGFAIDLIDFDPRFKKAFAYVFANTLIVDSISVARRIGIGSARMVTVDGDVCELSGAMTGGFRHKKKGRFKEKDLTKKLERAQADIAKAQQDIASLTGSRKDNEDKITKLRELKASLEGEIIKQEKSLHLNTGDLDASLAYKEELKKSLKDIDKNLATLEDDISDKTQSLMKLKVERQQLRSKIAELRNPRVLAELNAFEEKKRQLEQERVRLDTELKHTQSQIKDIVGTDKENIDKLLKDLKAESKKFKDLQESLSKDIKKHEKDLKKREEEQSVFFSKFKGLFETRKKVNDEVNAQESKILGIEENSRKLELQLNGLSIEEARIKAELAGLRADFEQYSGVELNMRKPEEQLKKEIQDFERMMARIGNVNMRALEIYDTVEKEYSTLLGKKDVLLQEKGDVLNMMEEIESNKKELFMACLNEINDQFKRIFSQLMTKGSSYLELENSQEPFEGGLRINVRLTGNKFLDIRSLSGGEKTMTALAFLFAIQEHEPASFYVLDEVDAALDKHNSEKLAELIRAYTNKAQYLVISHNDALIAEGDILYGVSMQSDSGLSKVVSLKL